MATYTVFKRMINDYTVKVEADSPEHAIEKALANDHEPGELTSRYNDGECFEPETWIVHDDNEKRVQ